MTHQSTEQILDLLYIQQLYYHTKLALLEVKTGQARNRKLEPAAVMNARPAAARSDAPPHCCRRGFACVRSGGHGTRAR